MRPSSLSNYTYFSFLPKVHFYIVSQWGRPNTVLYITGGMIGKLQTKRRVGLTCKHIISAL